MNHPIRTFLAVVTVTAVILYAMTMGIGGSAPAQDPGRPLLPKWEYKVIRPSTLGVSSPEGDAISLESQFNALGKDGWELALVFSSRRRIRV